MATVKKKPGMPKGHKTKKVALREEVQELAAVTFKDMMLEKTEDIVNVVYKKAMEGDMSAAKMWLDRVIPVSKAIDANSGSGDFNIQINIQNFEREDQGEIYENENGQVTEDVG